MYIIIEEHQYEATLVEEVLKGITNLRDVNDKVCVNYVGYYYNPTLKDCVFILPKVLIQDVNKEELVFGHCKPEEIINLDKQSVLTDEEYNFIYELSVWIYRAIVVFNENKKDNQIVLKQNAQEMTRGRLRQCHTFLDVLLALQRFNRENQDFFFFVLRNLHSGYNKINWTRTINHSTAFIQGGTPLYLDVINRKRQINFDEELLIIFFSILNYMKEHFGFPVTINVNYQLITGERFENYIKDIGKVRLMQIKYKYYSDKALYLWELCYAFFDRIKKVNIQVGEREYLLVKDFNIVFEAIIDTLIGDQDLPNKLKEQQDGKQVDHLYSYTSLTENDRSTYYIGDSKYYKRNTPIGEESEYKQYTYARNIIQWNINYFMQGNEATEKIMPLRDDVTEGYNIVPNFFISAHQNTLSSESNIKISDKDKNYFDSRQFYDRLFDRDTLLVLHYDVNFLYVVSLYARNQSGEKKSWKDAVRKEFRSKIQEELQNRYQFHAITPKLGTDDAKVIHENFQLLLGKVFSPYDVIDDRQYYSLALVKPNKLDNVNEEIRKKIAEENEEVMHLVEQYFLVEQCHLEDNPALVLKDAVSHDTAQSKIQVIQNTSFLTMHYLENYLDDYVLIGHVKDSAQMDWIFSKFTDYKLKKNGHKQKVGKYSNIYNVRCGSGREGAIKSNQKGTAHVRFVILCDADKGIIYGAYRAEHTSHIFSNEQMLALRYDNPSGPYRCYILEEEVNIGNIDLSRLLLDKKQEGSVKYAPIYLTGKELIEYRL